MNNAKISNSFKKILKKTGNSVTKQRILVFEELLGKEPLTMHELHSAMKDKIDRASLYRTVALFESLDIVHRIHIGWKYKIELSDNYSHHHHHLRCVSCEKIIVISNDKPLEDYIDKVSKQFNFHAKSHQFEVDGFCEDCSSQSRI